MAKTRMFVKTFAIIVAALVLVGTAYAQTSQAPRPDSLKPVTSAEMALEKAAAYTGFSEIEGLKKGDAQVSVHRVEMSDSTAPFVTLAKSPRPMWLVSIHDMILDLSGTPDSVEKAHPKDVDIYIDSTTGQFIKALVLDTGLDRSAVRECPRDQAEKQMTDISGEEYLGYPEEMPKLNMLSVMDSIWDCSIPAASWVSVRYVVHKHFHLGTAPSWIVHAHGYGGEFSHLRVVVDSETGRGRIAITLPQEGALSPDAGQE
ncbi:MAG TPA: hypothetical protein PLF13_02880 [candidate division Zixibacteria bacterium]|nr:hypothetical protein [candidate division Zixibacteria bacterium]